MHIRRQLASFRGWTDALEMETRFGVRLTSAMLDSGNMKKTLYFATHSMDKDMCSH